MPPKRSLEEINADYEAKQAAFEVAKAQLDRESRAVDLEITRASDLKHALSVQLAVERLKTEQWSAHGDASASAAQSRLGKLKEQRKTRKQESLARSVDFADAAWDVVDITAAADELEDSLEAARAHHETVRQLASGEVYHSPRGPAADEQQSPARQRPPLAPTSRPGRNADGSSPGRGVSPPDLEEMMRPHSASVWGDASTISADPLTPVHASVAAVDVSVVGPEARSELDRIAQTTAKLASRLGRISTTRDRVQTALDDLTRVGVLAAAQPGTKSVNAVTASAPPRRLILLCSPLPYTARGEQGQGDEMAVPQPWEHVSEDAFANWRFWCAIHDVARAAADATVTRHGFHCRSYGPAQSGYTLASTAAAPTADPDERVRTDATAASETAGYDAELALEELRHALDGLGRAHPQSACTATAAGLATTPHIVVIVARLKPGWVPGSEPVLQIALPRMRLGEHNTNDRGEPASLAGRLLQKWRSPANDPPQQQQQQEHTGDDDEASSYIEAQLPLAELYQLAIAENVVNPNVALFVDAYSAASDASGSCLGFSLLATTRDPYEPRVWFHGRPRETAPPCPLAVAFADAAALGSALRATAADQQPRSSQSADASFTASFDASTATAADAVSVPDLVTAAMQSLKGSTPPGGVCAADAAIKRVETAMAEGGSTTAAVATFIGNASDLGLPFQGPASPPDSSSTLPSGTAVIIARPSSLRDCIDTSLAAAGHSTTAQVARRRPMAWRPALGHEARRTSSTVDLAVATEVASWWQCAQDALPDCIVATDPRLWGGNPTADPRLVERLKRLPSAKGRAAAVADALALAVHRSCLPALEHRLVAVSNAALLGSTVSTTTNVSVVRAETHKANSLPSLDDDAAVPVRLLLRITKHQEERSAVVERDVPVGSSSTDDDRNDIGDRPSTVPAAVVADDDDAINDTSTKPRDNDDDDPAAKGAAAGNEEADVDVPLTADVDDAPKEEEKEAAAASAAADDNDAAEAKDKRNSDTAATDEERDVPATNLAASTKEATPSPSEDAILEHLFGGFLDAAFAQHHDRTSSSSASSTASEHLFLPLEAVRDVNLTRDEDADGDASFYRLSGTFASVEALCAFLAHVALACHDGTDDLEVPSRHRDLAVEIISGVAELRETLELASTNDEGVLPAAASRAARALRFVRGDGQLGTDREPLRVLDAAPCDRRREFSVVDSQHLSGTELRRLLGRPRDHGAHYRDIARKTDDTTVPMPRGETRSHEELQAIWAVVTSPSAAGVDVDAAMHSARLTAERVSRTMAAGLRFGACSSAVQVITHITASTLPVGSDATSVEMRASSALAQALPSSVFEHCRFVVDAELRRIANVTAGAAYPPFLVLLASRRPRGDAGGEDTFVSSTVVSSISTAAVDGVSASTLRHLQAVAGTTSA